MSNKIEGTIVLDGLIEGRVPDDPAVHQKLKEWVQLLEQFKLPVHLEMSGSSFSILPDNTAVDTKELGADPEQTIRQALEQLLTIIPQALRSQVFSTLRSSEYRKNQEIQALYGVNPDGTIEVAKRTVDAETVAPPQPLSRRERARYIITGLVIATVVLGLSYAYPGTRKFWTQMGRTVTPTSAEEITVKLGAFEPYLKVVDKQVIDNGGYLVLLLGPTEKFPVNDAQIDEAAKAAGDSVKGRLAVEAIARQRIELEVTVKDRGIYSRSVDLRSRTAEGLVLIKIQLPQKERVETVELKY